MDDSVKQRFFEIYDAIETPEKKDVLLQNKEYVYMYLDILNQMYQHTPRIRMIQRYFETSTDEFEKECSCMKDIVSEAFHLAYAVLFEPAIGWASVVKYMKTVDDVKSMTPETRMIFYISIVSTILSMAITVESLQDYASWIFVIATLAESSVKRKLTGYDLILIIAVSSFIGEE